MTYEMSIHLSINLSVLSSESSTESSVHFSSKTSKHSKLTFDNRFQLVRAALHPTAPLVAVVDKVGALYIIDLLSNRFRLARRLSSAVTAVSFVNSDLDCNLVIASVDRNSVHFFHFCPQSLAVRSLAVVESAHRTSIAHISFDGQNRIMTSSAFDSAVVWDVRSLREIKRLSDSKSLFSRFWIKDTILTIYRNRVFIMDAMSYRVLEQIQNTRLLHVFDDMFITENQENQKERHFLNENREIESRFVNDSEDSYFPPKNTTFVDKNNDFSVVFDSKSQLIVNYLNQNSPKKKKIRVKEENIEKNVRELARVLIAKYWKFPQKYRFFIWTQLLGLPDDRKRFQRLNEMSVELRSEVRFAVNSREFVDPSVGRCLVELLAQLIQWRPELLSETSVSDLSLFCFPFVKILNSKPVVLFETMASLVINNFLVDKRVRETTLWTLSSKLLRRESPALDRHLRQLDVSADDMFVPLLTSLFSEVFLRTDWFQICDLLLTFGTQLFVYFLVAFSLHSEPKLLKLKTRQQIKTHFRTQQSISAKEVISSVFILSQRYLPLSEHHFQPLLY
ncbi:uncharacterized protein LOC128961427 [Oppia nitens]|uniref:uncharacterized protein LOC128961427 n=1 Tax=Oppia nitens TaxID=1686743 RepID=UPI0023DCA6D8|nr:uncharacterized protein LOC128961427 [Oppia nitens]